MELCASVNDYLDGRITLAQLEEWLTPRLRAVLSTPDTDIAYIAGTVELCIAEIAGGIRTERSAKTFLRRHLADRLRVPVIYMEYDASPTRVISGSSSRYIITPPLVSGPTPPRWLTGVRIEPQRVSA